jgi:hypothetical protein
MNTQVKEALARNIASLADMLHWREVLGDLDHGATAP